MDTVKRARLYCILLVVACIAAGSGFLRAEFPAAGIDQYLDACAARGEFNGVVLVARKGEVQYHRALGAASIDGSVELRKDSVFRLASVAKAFTAVSILLLGEEGKLSLDDDVRKYVPTLPYAGATIRHLLHHTSGLPDYVKLLDQHWDAEQGDLSRRKFATNPDALGLIIKHKPPARFAPGKRWDYSNTGYMLLALVVEKISELPFSDFLTRRIFAPLGMKDTVLFTPITPPSIEHRAWGFRLSPDGGERLANDRNYLNAMYGDGEVYSTAGDLLKWDQALYQERLIPGAAVEEMFTPGRLSSGKETGYGYGWGIAKRAGKKVVNHGGGWVGFRTWIDRELESRQLLVVLTNNSSRSMGMVRDGVLAILAGKEPRLPKSPVSRLLGERLRRDGLTGLKAEYRRLKSSRAKEIDFSEARLRQLGSYLLGKKKASEAVAVLELNAEAFPKSARAREELGDALLVAGRRKEAGEAFRQALTLKPGSGKLKKKLAKSQEP
ncbi:MAG: serine hydrolase [Planctomycetota bacterium]|nr:serine hydrolase [Planctomycetota bacterium]